MLTVARKTLDLRRQADVEAWLLENRPDPIFIPAATVGGILANSTRPAEFLNDNLAIAANVIHGAVKADVAKLMFLGAVCLYPRLAPQPMSEDSLLTGPLEPTNEWYTVAKIAGVKLCQAYRRQHGGDFIVAVPANLYGPGDNFDVQAGHVVPGLITRAHEARASGAPALSIWGSGVGERAVPFTRSAGAFLSRTRWLADHQSNTIKYLANRKRTIPHGVAIPPIRRHGAQPRISDPRLACIRGGEAHVCATPSRTII